MWRTVAAAVALTAILIAPAAPAGKIYKWTDAEGNVHYGASVPSGQSGEQVNVHASRPSGTAKASARKKAPAETESTAASEGQKSPEDTKAKSDTEFLRQQCKLARNNIKALEAGGVQARYRSADGQVVRYTEEQLKEQIAKNRKYLDTYCQQD